MDRKRNKSKLGALLVVVAVITAAALLFTACGKQRSDGDGGEAEAPANTAEEKAEEKDAEGKTGGRLKVVTTIFPVYDWMRNVAGDACDVDYVMKNGADMHSYEPTIQDIAAISEADVFVYVGGESEVWVEKALKQAKNKDMAMVALLTLPGYDCLMQKGEDGEKEPDEHVWLSVRNAGVFTEEFGRILSEKDPANKDVYEENAKEYAKKLKALDSEFAKKLKGKKKKPVVFGGRFPFRYMFYDYGLKHLAAFDGCSTESEASFKTIKGLASKMDKLGLKAIITLDDADQKIALAINKETKKKDKVIYVMDPMQASIDITGTEGVDYLTIMEGNLDILLLALE